MRAKHAREIRWAILLARTVITARRGRAAPFSDLVPESDVRDRAFNREIQRAYDDGRLPRPTGRLWP